MLCPIAGRIETCPYDRGNVAQNGGAQLRQGFQPLFCGRRARREPRRGETKWRRNNGGVASSRLLITPKCPLYRGYHPCL